MDVRRSFRSKYCHEYELPSGGGSGFFQYPITSAEVEQLTADYSDDELKSAAIWQQCKNNSEVRLWVALRLKYGINYLNPIRNQFWLPDFMYTGIPEPDPMEDIKHELSADIQQAISELCDLSAKVNDLRREKIEKDFKKNFDSDLTTAETML